MQAGFLGELGHPALERIAFRVEVRYSSLLLSNNH